MYTGVQYWEKEKTTHNYMQMYHATTTSKNTHPNIHPLKKHKGPIHTGGTLVFYERVCILNVVVEFLIYKKWPVKCGCKDQESRVSP